MRSRFIEVQDNQLTNHGKFWIAQFAIAEQRYVSAITGTPLLSSLPPVKRFGGRINQSSIFMLDLQTHEGMVWDPAENAEGVRRRFLVHPLHVCLLYFPLMLYLARTGDIWRLPKLVTLPIADVVAQPGVLLDATGQQVRGQREWSRRAPLIARLRNREVPAGADPEAGQGELTEEAIGDGRG